MQSNPKSSWSGFLPKRAIVMARKAEARIGAEVVFVGEIDDAPHGPAALLLRKMIEAMGLSDEQVCICNVASFRKLSTLHLKMVVALGESTTRVLLQNEAPLSELRGQFQWHDGIRFMPTFDPSFLLAHPHSKREAWLDLQAVARELGLTIPGRKN